MWLIVVGLFGLVQVEGAAECPTPDAVRAALGRLGVDELTGGERVDLATTGDEVRVRWIDDAGHVLHERRIPRDGSCDELADAAALVVAIWSGRLDAGRHSLAPSLPEPPPPAPPAVVRARGRSRLAYEVAAGLVVGWEPGAAAAVGGTAELTLGPRASRFAARIAVVGQSLQQHALAVGQIDWTRPALSLGARVRLERSHVRFEVSADALAALLVVAGAGLTSSQQAYDFDPGLGVGVRLGYHVRTVTPFVDVRLVGWLRSQTAVVAGAGSGYQLPRVDLWASAGLAIGP